MRRTIRGKSSIRSVSIMRLRTDTSHPLPPALRLLLDDIDEPANCIPAEQVGVQCTASGTIKSVEFDRDGLTVQEQGPDSTYTVRLGMAPTGERDGDNLRAQRDGDARLHAPDLHDGGTGARHRR